MASSKLVSLKNLESFLRREVLSNLDGEWRIYNNDSLVRNNEWALNGVNFYRLNRGSARLLGFSQLFAIPSRALSLTVGSRLQRQRKKGFLTFLPRKNEYFDFEWSERHEEIENIVSTIKSQLRPPYGVPMKPEAMLEWIQETFGGNENLEIRWTLGLVSAMTGDKQNALQNLEIVTKKYEESSLLSISMDLEERAVEERNCSVEVARAITAIEENALDQYIENRSLETRRSLGIP